MTKDELQECESVIERGKQTFLEVGEALLKIKERKGYKLQYNTFEEYCQKRWGFTASYARRQIKSADTLKLLQQNDAPGHENITEKQLRPITVLPPEQQIAFAQTHDISRMTATEIAQAVKGEPKQQEQDVCIEKLSRKELVELCRCQRELIADLEIENKDLRDKVNEYVHLVHDPFDECEEWGM